MKALLGGKGANLAEMANLGLPVPPGFTISTEVCTAYYANDRAYPAGLEAAGGEPRWSAVEAMAGAVFGDAGNPLLVSVRSGARASMPGMMDTVLNLGLNDETVEGLAQKSGDRRFAYDSYRRFISMYSDVVLGVDHAEFEDILGGFKDQRGYALDTEVTAEEWQGLIARYKALVAEETGKPFPQDVTAQLWGAIGAVFTSWNGARAITYRKLNHIPEDWGTAVNVQAMVFGNMGDTSATGVAFTRNPSTGARELYGEFLVNAQGEDVVAGIRTPQNITEKARLEAASEAPSLEALMPGTFAELRQHFRPAGAPLPRHAGHGVHHPGRQALDAADAHRKAHRQGRPADRRRHGGGRADHAGQRPSRASIPPRSTSCSIPHSTRKAKREVIATGLPASPGAASGEIVFDADEAERLKALNRRVILVRIETSPEDIHGMHAAEGILTTRGGMTSHAAVVARGMGKPCVSGAGSLRIDYQAGTLSVMGVSLKKGDTITIDGSTGQVMKGEVATIKPELSGDFATLMGWADGFRRMGVRANAETPLDARTARDFGAEGIGLCRTEHMFFEAEPHPGGARDDPRRQDRGPPQGAGQAAADAARRLHRALRDHGGPSGHDPPARPAAPRIPAAGRPRDRGGGGADERQPGYAARPGGGAQGVQPHAGPPRGEAADLLSRDRRNAGARHFRGGDRGRPPHRQGADPGGDGAAGRLEERARPGEGPGGGGGRQVAKETGVAIEYSVGTMIELPRAALRAAEIAAVGGLLLLRHQ